MKPRLLLLTNTDNSSPEEDKYLADFLRDIFDVTRVHPRDAGEFEDVADLILVRNIWPTETQLPELHAMYARFARKNLCVYNPFIGHGDMQGKKYLPELWRLGYPVIPSVERVSELGALPLTENFMVKPLFGGSSFGVKKIARSKLEAMPLTDHIIQPFLQIEKEISFYFIDNELQHVLATRGDRWNLQFYDATDEQKMIAQNFVQWNSLPRGIQRIDFALTFDGEFLLMEIEDWCPFLSLRGLDAARSALFFEAIRGALLRAIFFAND